MEAGDYEWDNAKAAFNLRKHGVSFEEAATIFNDPGLRLRKDEVHSTHDEERWLAIGFSGKARLLAVVSVDRQGRVRLISARKATRHEERQYVEN